jgi:hypothetical protein
MNTALEPGLIDTAASIPACLAEGFDNSGFTVIAAWTSLSRRLSRSSRHALDLAKAACKSGNGFIAARFVD